jgi:hypothetical protein
LAVIDRMMAVPSVEKSVPVEPASNPRAAAANTEERPAQVEKTVRKDTLDETAELFRTVFKGEIVP